MARTLAEDISLRDAGDVENAISEASARVAELSDQPCTYHQVSASLYQLMASLEAAEAAGLPFDQIRAACESAREAYAGSSFVARLQRWPRGYPGDFETIEELFQSQDIRSREIKRSFFYDYLDHICLNTPIAQQHRNKISYQANWLKAQLAEIRECRVLSIACGGSLDLASLSDSDLAQAHVVLNDVDDDALRLSTARLAGRTRDLATVEGDVFGNIRRLRRLGPFDLVVAGGLYDYLSSKHARRLNDIILSKLLRPNGRFLFTNIRAGNPFAVWLRYLVAWDLTERSADDISTLIDGLPYAGAWTAKTDKTGLTWLVDVPRSASRDAEEKESTDVSQIDRDRRGGGEP